MKKADAITSVLLIPIDYLMFIAAGLVSYGLRYHGFITHYRPVFFDYPLSDFVPALLLISTIGIIIFALTGSYSITSSVKLTETFSKVLLGVSTTVLIVIVTIFLKRELFSSRFIIIIAWFLAIILVFIGRIILYKLKSIFLRKGYGTHHLLIIGHSLAGMNITTYFQNNLHLGYRVIDTISDFDNPSQQKIDILHKEQRLDEVLDVRGHVDHHEFIDMIHFFHERNIIFRFIPTIYQTQTINFELDSTAGYPIIQVNKTPLEGWGRIVKRIIDLTVASIGLIVLAPFFLIINILIRYDSPGPVFVRLRRVGRGGREFILYKFRSMIIGAHEMKQSIRSLNERDDGPLFKIHNDPRITRIGRLLRKSSIDELPQLWNVLKGEMSLIGPRPHEPEEIEHYRREYRTLLAAKPGISGLAQISGRSVLPFSEEVSLDMYYVENWSLGLDLRILAKTFIVVFKFKDAA